MGAKGGVNIGNAWMNVSAQFGSVPKDLSKALNGAADSANAKGIGSGIGDELGLGLVSKVAGLGTAIAGAIGFANIASEAVAASDATDKFKSTLSFAGLDTSKISELTQTTQEYADKTVYSLSDIQGITAQLASNAVPNYDKLAEAAGNLNAVSGGNAETFKSVGLVLTQTAGAGKLTGDNWRQLAQAIPGASGKIKTALAENSAYTGDFVTAMSKGEISAGEFNQAILDLGMTDVAGDAATSTSTIEGAWGNLQATLVGTGTDIVNVLKPALTTAMNAATGLIGGLKGVAAWAGQNSTWLLPLAAGVGALAIGFGALNVASTIAAAGGLAKWIAQTRIAAAVQGAFNLVMSANPISLVIIAIAALVAALVVFFTQTETGRQAWASFTSWLSGVWESVSSAWTTAWNAITNFLSSLWNGIKATASGMWNGLISWVTGIPDRFMAGLAALGQLAAQFAAWVGGAKDAAVNKFWELVDWVTGIPGRILGALGNLGSLLSDAGRQIISGLWDGLRGKFEDVKSWVGGIGDWIADHKGPKAYDLALLVPNGGWIMQGLNDGLSGGFGDVLDNVSSMGSRLRDEISGATVRAASVVGVSAVPAYAAGSLASSQVGGNETTAYLTDDQVERLARAFETGSTRVVSAQQKRFARV